jgi:hypothetical protein
VTAILGEFGPVYPDLGPSVAKYRRAAKAGLASLSKAQRHAYADAIEKAIRAKQRAALQRELPSHRVSCTSGTNHNDGTAIDAAIRQQHRSALQAYVSKVRRDRTPQQWSDMYEKAMAEKRKQKESDNASILANTIKGHARHVLAGARSAMD